MPKSGRVVVVALLAARTCAALADTQETQNVWTTWNGSWRFEGRWGLSTDLTLRSTDDWADLRSVEVREGVTYAASSRLSLAGGVSMIRNNDAGPDTTETRLWSQFATPQVLGGARVTHRLRVEERFIQRIGKPQVQATRLRYQTKAQIPFTEVTYGILQQEVMAHVAGARDLNGHAFDQQRLYAGVGRRFAPGTDVEMTYMHQFLSGRTVDTRGHVVILTLVTRF